MTNQQFIPTDVEIAVRMAHAKDRLTVFKTVKDPNDLKWEDLPGTGVYAFEDPDVLDPDDVLMGFTKDGHAYVVHSAPGDQWIKRIHPDESKDFKRYKRLKIWNVLEDMGC